MVMQTGAISESVQRGKHITSHREMFVLERGGILIDNPGMREVGIADTGSGLAMTFDMIVSLSPKCKFKDCTHTSEVGCAVLEAVENGSIDRSSYDNYLKMEREKEYYDSSVEERHKKEKTSGSF